MHMSIITRSLCDTYWTRIATPSAAKFRKIVFHIQINKYLCKIPRHATQAKTGLSGS